MILIRRLTVPLLKVCIWLCVWIPFILPFSPAHGQVSSQIQTLIDNSLAGNAFWSVQVRDSSGRVLENLNGDKLIRPASNLKLISSGVFLDRLGPYYRYRTTLFGRGYQDGDRWRGDLVIQGSGDPSINGDFYNDNPLFLFERWVHVLDSLGIRQIDGNVVGYEGLFDDVPYPKGWEWDDLSYYYAPEINALSFNSNVVELEVVADGRIGTTPRIQWFPFNTPYVEFINEQLVTSPNARFRESYRRVLGTNTIILRSTLPQGHYDREPLTVMEPSLYFIDTFSRFLEMEGIQVRGRLVVDRDSHSWDHASLSFFDTHTSEPLYKLMGQINQESNNFYAEMMLKTVAANVYGTQGTTDLGLRVMRDFLHEMGIDTLSVQLRDASGLAPATLIKAGDLNRYLVYTQHKNYFNYLFDSLAIGGVNGTLRYRFQNSEVRGKFFGKTGFISGVRALSGYLNTSSGQRLAVTIVTNNYTARTAHVDAVHERIMEYIYTKY